MRPRFSQNRFVFLLILLTFAGTALAQTKTPYLHAPSLDTYAKHNPNGVTILPEGKLLKPVGKHLPVLRWPHGLVLSPDNQTLFVGSGNGGQTITGWDSAAPKNLPLATPLTTEGGRRSRRSNAGAAAFSPDGKTLYWSSGDSGEVYVVDVATRTFGTSIPLNIELNGRKFADSFAMDLKISADGAFLYCADVTNFRVAVIDTAKKAMVASINVGRYPYALALVGKRVYVANIGMFQYSPVPAPTGDAAAKYDKRGLTVPPFAFPSKEAMTGVDLEGRHIPAIGNPNVPEAMSVWGVDVTDPTHPKIVQKIKTGLLVGAISDQNKTIGGSGPNYLLASGTNLYVSNNNNDTVERINTLTGKITLRTRLIPSPLVAKLRGVAPAGMAVSPNGKRLYVAESGLNAIAVLDTTTGKILGHIPTGWYPYRVELTKNGKEIVCICFKGFGNGPRGGANAPKDPYMGMMGSLHIIPAPTTAAQLAQMTKNTLTYNGIVDRSAERAKIASPLIPTVPGKISPEIKYVVFITKENHTYDTIFDHVKGANDDPTMLQWGYNQTVSAEGQPTLEHVAVMTNHNALAKQFVVSDNFYMEPEASGVGHRWLVGVQPNNWCQMTYTLGWNFIANSTAPGRRASFGSNGSIAPEDYPEAGSMWEHLARHNVSFRNYGEGFEFAGVGEDAEESKTGAREVVNIPMSKVLYDNTCFDFPIFNTNIPDQYRAYWFEQDVRKLFLSGKKAMPHFINIAICNDHGAGLNASRGYPYRASWMADNDLALGRIVEFLSHTPYWKHMVILVTQDDAGGEADHVDAQRSVLLCISPWVKRGYVSHRHTTITSMHRTLYEIFGLPSLNLFDALVNDFSDCFTTKPNFAPYTHTEVDKRVFDPERAKDPKDPDYQQARRLPSVIRDAAVTESLRDDD